MRCRSIPGETPTSIASRATRRPIRSSRWAPTMRATSPTNRQAEAGFALFELVLALAILGLVAGIVFPRVARGPGPAELGTTAQEIAALLRSDRNSALRHRREVVSRIDVAQGIVTSGGS